MAIEQSPASRERCPHLVSSPRNAVGRPASDRGRCRDGRKTETETPWSATGHNAGERRGGTAAKECCKRNCSVICECKRWPRKWPCFPQGYPHCGKQPSHHVPSILSQPQALVNTPSELFLSPGRSCPTQIYWLICDRQVGNVPPVPPGSPLYTPLFPQSYPQRAYLCTAIPSKIRSQAPVLGRIMMIMLWLSWLK
jgi:hypothetical protein